MMMNPETRQSGSDACKGDESSKDLISRTTLYKMYWRGLPRWLGTGVYCTEDRPLQHSMGCTHPWPLRQANKDLLVSLRPY